MADQVNYVTVYLTNAAYSLQRRKIKQWSMAIYGIKPKSYKNKR